METIMLWLIAGHFIGDFPCQSEWMVREKGKSWEVNAYHALTYTVVVYIVAAIGGINLSFWGVGLCLGSHFLIDPLKARWGLIKSIWLDQALHFVVLGVIAALI